MNRALVLAAGLLFPGLAASQTIVPINIRAAYLHADPADSTYSAIPIHLSTFGLAPGATIQIQPVGDWDAGPGGDEQVNMLAVFSGSATLLGPTLPDRVPDAIGAGITAFTGNTWPTGEPTDIAHDFVMLDTIGVTVTIPAGATHLFVTVADIYYRDNFDPDGDFGAKITLLSATDAPVAAAGFDALSAQPNPFQDETAIRFEVRRAATMRLTVHDVAGRLVRTLLDGGMAPGRHLVTWDGRISSGRRAAPGIYFARLDDGQQRQTVRVSLVR